MPGSDIYRHCDDVAAVLDAIGFDRVVVGGHSMGGAVALDFRLMSEAPAERLPNAVSHFWPDSGHVPNLEQPAAFNQLVANFLNTVNTTRSNQAQ
ncbi:MAG: alpha/beta fold hydrolase [Acidimicrobiales bacterium]|jgi:pimeloyl-ACP methyl ester carboxylesterase